MRPDGSILDQPGFDAATRLLLIDPPSMAPIPDSPTRDDALDNLSGALSGDALCQYIERPRPQVRVLGKSELIIRGWPTSKAEPRRFSLSSASGPAAMTGIRWPV